MFNKKLITIMPPILIKIVIKLNDLKAKEKNSYDSLL